MAKNISVVPWPPFKRSGTVISPRISGDSFSLANQQSWSAGVAVTAGNYSIGRDADATNQLHFNVPTGASMEWSVNDAAALVLNATNFQPGINDGLALGVSGTAWADLYLASGATIDFLAGDVVLTHSANTLTMTGGNLVLTQPVVDASAPTALTITGGAHTALTAATEDIGANFNFSATKTWAAGAGPLAVQREIVIQAPTYAGNAGGALTITNAATVAITGGAVEGASMTITNSHALLIQAGAVSTAGTSYGLTVNAQTGATNNYAAQFMGGRVGIGTATPETTLDVFGRGYFDEWVVVERLGETGGTNAIQLTPRAAGSISNFGNPAGNGAAEISFTTGMSGAVFGTLGAGPIVLGTNNIARFWIDSAGKVGLGATTPTHFFQITAGTLASTISAQYVSATFTDAVGVDIASNYQITTAGTLAISMTGLNVNMLAGYTGSGYSYAGNFSTNVAATGADWISGAANIGVIQQSIATTVGDNVGNWSRAYGGNVNIGVAAQAITAKNGATNIGVIGLGKNTGTTPIQIGGYFGLNATEPTFASAALMADNSDQTSDIFVARDNGTAVFTIADAAVVITQNSSGLGIGGAPTYQIDAIKSQAATTGMRVYNANTGGIAAILAQNDLGNTTLQSIGSTEGATGWASYGRLRTDSGLAGLVIATGGAGDPIVFAVNDTEVFRIAANGLMLSTPRGTGTLVDFALETEWTSGTLLNADFAGATTQAGNYLGIVLDFNTNQTGVTDQDITGYQLTTPALTQSAANTTTYIGFDLPTAGALIQDTLAGTIAWYGAKIQMPNITQTTGTVTSYGLYINGGTVTSGTQYAVFVDSGNVRFDGGQTVNRTASAAGNYTVLITDYIIGKTGITGGGDTVTLPSAVTAGAGKIYILKDESGTAGTNNITINSASGNIDGAASKTISSNYGAMMFHSDGTNWFID